MKRRSTYSLNQGDSSNNRKSVVDDKDGQFRQSYALGSEFVKKSSTSTDSDVTMSSVDPRDTDRKKKTVGMLEVVSETILYQLNVGLICSYCALETFWLMIGATLGQLQSRCLLFVCYTAMSKKDVPQIGAMSWPSLYGCIRISISDRLCLSKKQRSIPIRLPLCSNYVPFC